MFCHINGLILTLILIQPTLSPFSHLHACATNIQHTCVVSSFHPSLIQHSCLHTDHTHWWQRDVGLEPYNCSLQPNVSLREKKKKKSLSSVKTKLNQTHSILLGLLQAAIIIYIIIIFIHIIIMIIFILILIVIIFILIIIVIIFIAYLLLSI